MGQVAGPPTNLGRPSDSAPVIVRPGISQQTLALAGSGHRTFLNPTRLRFRTLTLTGNRPDSIGGGYQLSEKRSEISSNTELWFHVYFPPGGIKESLRLVIVEGEFKALSIFELEINVIGLCGLYIYKRDEEGNRRLLAEIDQAIARSCAEKVYFIGDADTTTNLNFARSAQFLADKLSPIPVLLPRLPLDGPKGIDDWKDGWDGASDGEASARLESLLGSALQVEPRAFFRRACGDIA